MTHHEIVVRIRHEHIVAAGALHDFGLGLANRVHGAEKFQVGGAHVRPHAHFGLRNIDERADFSKMVHAKLNDRDVRLVPQFQQ